MGEARPGKIKTALVEEASSVYRVRVINQLAAAAIHKASIEGDKEVAEVLDVLTEYFKVLTDWPTCLACDRAIDPKAIPLIVLMKPLTGDASIDGASVAVANCMCDRCVADCPDGNSLTRGVCRLQPENHEESGSDQPIVRSRARAAWMRQVGLGHHLCQMNTTIGGIVVHGLGIALGQRWGRIGHCPTPCASRAFFTPTWLIPTPAAAMRSATERRLRPSARRARIVVSASCWTGTGTN